MLYAHAELLGPEDSTTRENRLIGRWVNFEVGYSEGVVFGSEV